ncbi:MAG: Unknown protein [uncultured Thiotrichaceae bacterium]|uniref:Uncharacterized protein n=1 Tax=uncultured Thiotrichaceae bacterium TaxID=298394 RepID=A0A6S6UBE4_9GAMM|nr:MAG: Unknown protein [uncultured Thiotrichaceae bacterium]
MPEKVFWSQAYLHGLFDTPDVLREMFKWAGLSTSVSVDINKQREQQLERLANMLEEYLAVDKLIEMTHSFNEIPKAQAHNC